MSAENQNENEKQNPNPEWLDKVAGPIEIWAGYVGNAVAWVIFVATGNGLLEIIMGLVCVYCLLVGIQKRSQSGARTLMIWSAVDAVWMFSFAFGESGGGSGLSLLRTFM
jgi:hypothetical protein